MSPSDLRRIQKAAGLSDAALAEQLGCSVQHVRRMKMDPSRSGHRPILAEIGEKIKEMEDERTGH
jgi:predicted transcriptional regulator